MPCLVQKASDGSAVKQWKLGEKPLTVGRGDKADAKIDDKEMSRLHFTISRQGNGHVLRDCNSINGTRVNGKRVESETLLQPNDQIRAGKTDFVFELGVSTMIAELDKEQRHYSSFVRELKQKHKD